MRSLATSTGKVLDSTSCPLLAPSSPWCLYTSTTTLEPAGTLPRSEPVVTLDTWMRSHILPPTAPCFWDTDRTLPLPVTSTLSSVAPNSWPARRMPSLVNRVACQLTVPALSAATSELDTSNSVPLASLSIWSAVSGCFSASSSFAAVMSGSPDTGS